MKARFDIPDTLLEAARQVARRDGITLHFLIERGLRLAFAERRKASAFRLRDASVDGCGLHPKAESLSPQDLLALAYGHRIGTRSPS